jgi:molybdenum cofactor synthesis domain-containing protein
MKDSKTAGIIIIGNEILSGKVRDSNSFYLLTELRALGVNVRRISVIPDEVEVIGREIREFSERYDYVFTSGGVGPTHDDVTMAGVAKGFGVRLIRHPEILRILSLRYNTLNDAVLKMSEVPEGSEIIFQEEMRFPVISFRNVFIFPGIPEYLKKKFSMIKERFRCSHFYLRRVFLNAHEVEIADVLSSIVNDNRDVIFGSYPVVDKKEYSLILTAEAKEESALNKALDELMRRIPKDKLMKVE